MKKSRLPLLPTLAAVACLASPLAQAENCATPAGALRVDFPNRSQERRDHGTVKLDLKLDTEGRVVAAEITESSGHAELDRAAARSARRYWRFDVAACSTTELAQPQAAVVSFQRPPGISVSGTLNRAALTRARALLSDSRCHSNEVSHEDIVFSCRKS